MHDTALVRRGQAQQRALQDHKGGLWRGAALVDQDLAQRDAVDQFHDDGGTGGRFDVFVQADDVRVFQGGQHGCLAAEHPGEARVGEKVMAQVLDRHQDT